MPRLLIDESTLLTVCHDNEWNNTRKWLLGATPLSGKVGLLVLLRHVFASPPSREIDRLRTWYTRENSQC